MGQPYGKLLLVKTAPRKEYSVRRPDINPSVYYKNKPNTAPKAPNIQNSTPLSNPYNAPVCDLLAPITRKKQTKLYQKPPTQIKIGERNSYLTSAQGYYSRKGLSGQELKSQILKLNSQLSAPLSEQEVHSITYYPNSSFSVLQNPTSESIRTYVIDTQKRLDFATAWSEFSKTYVIIKTNKPTDRILPAEITMLFKSLYPESKLMFKSDHALECTIGKRLAFDRFTWECDPDGMTQGIYMTEAYLHLNKQEIIHAEVNKSRTVVRSKSLNTYGLDSDSIEFKTIDSQNRAYVGYKLVELKDMSMNSNTVTLECVIYELYSEEGSSWVGGNRYTGVCARTSIVLSILNKLDAIERRKDWALCKLRTQWEESVQITHPPEVTCF
jgi:hypothetical protein